MISLLLHLLRLLPFLLGGHRQLALENLALRQQLAVYKRTVTRPPLRRRDRLFWVGLARVWAGWKQSLVIVTPDTVLRWQRRRFRAYWTQLSGLSFAKTGSGPPEGSRRSPGKLEKLVRGRCLHPSAVDLHAGRVCGARRAARRKRGRTGVRRWTASKQTGAIAILGDSITDSFASTCP
jgi:hypothetical protein